MHKKILLVGSMGKAAIESYYCKHLRTMGFDVSVFDCVKFYDSMSLKNRLLRRLGHTKIYQSANRELVKHCVAKRPDFLWVFKGVELTSTTLCAIKELGITLANFNPDHPFIRTSVAHGGSNIAECVPLYDIYFSYSRKLRDELSGKGSQRSIWLPFGFELLDTDYTSALEDCEQMKVCFIGTLDANRTTTLRALARNGIPIDFYGPSCRFSRRLKAERNVRVRGLVFDTEFWKIARRYRIQLNFFRPHNRGSHNQRSFEVPSVGGILLTPDSAEQRLFFNEGEEMFFYRNEGEIPDLVETIFSMSTKEILEIRDNARRRSILSDYSYSARSAIVAEEFMKY